MGGHFFSFMLWALVTIVGGCVLLVIAQSIVAAVLFYPRRTTELQRETIQVLHAVLLNLTKQRITGFTIKRTGEAPMNPITPGTTVTFTAVPIPPDATLASPPVWSSSDGTNAPVTADPTGLIGTVEVPAGAALVSFTLTISYTNADGTVATDTITESIVAAVIDVTGFTITRTS